MVDSFPSCPQLPPPWATKIRHRTCAFRRPLPPPPPRPPPFPRAIPFLKRGSLDARSWSGLGISCPAAARHCTRSPAGRGRRGRVHSSPGSLPPLPPTAQFAHRGQHSAYAQGAHNTLRPLAQATPRPPPPLSPHLLCALRWAAPECMPRHPCHQHALCARCGARACRCPWLCHN